MIVVEMQRTIGTNVTQLPDGTRLEAREGQLANTPGWTYVSIPSEERRVVAVTVPGGKIEIFYREAAILERSNPEAHAEVERKTVDRVPPVIPQQGSPPLALGGFLPPGVFPCLFG